MKNLIKWILVVIILAVIVFIVYSVRSAMWSNVEIAPGSSTASVAEMASTSTSTISLSVNPATPTVSTVISGAMAPNPIGNPGSSVLVFDLKAPATTSVAKLKSLAIRFSVQGTSSNGLSSAYLYQNNRLVSRAAVTANVATFANLATPFVPGTTMTFTVKVDPPRIGTNNLTLAANVDPNSLNIKDTNGLKVNVTGEAKGNQITITPANTNPNASSTTSITIGSPTTYTLNPSMAGISYEKTRIATPLFRSDNTAYVNLLKRLGGSVIRLGGTNGDKIVWNPSGPGSVYFKVSPADIDRLAGLLQAINWKVIYGISLASSTPAAAADEAAYAAKAFGNNLLGFEIGNEPDLYRGDGSRPSTYSYSNFISEWETYAGAIRAKVPGAPLVGPGAGPTSNMTSYTIPFSSSEGNKISLLTQHYYWNDAKDTTPTLDKLFTPDPNNLPSILQKLQSASSKISGGYRLDEANSFWRLGAVGTSNGFGSALWTIDFLFTNAQYGSSGVNFHGGGNGANIYTPIADNGQGVVDGVRPVYYGMYLFSMAAHGTLLNTQVSLKDPLFSAYAVAENDGSTAVVLVNKNKTKSIPVTITFTKPISRTNVILLTAPSLESMTGITIGGNPVNTDGSWQQTSNPTSSIDKTKVTITVPAGSAELVQAN